MAKRKHEETQAPVEGMQAALDDVMDWLRAHSLPVIGVGVGLIVLGGGLAGAYEWRRSANMRAFDDLAAVEHRLVMGLGGSPGDVIVAEPANAEQARKTREAALGGYESVAAEYAGAVAARSATLRAAEAEIDLGLLEAAEARLARALESWDADDPLAGVAARLLGFVLEEQGRLGEAALAYAAAGGNPGYPARGSAWAQAGDAHARADQIDAAIAAFRELRSLDPEFAERSGAITRLNELQALSPVPAASE